MHAHPQRTAGRREGFTLIELLVVVTVIIVLLALLTPALDKAIYAAEKVDCLSRQRVLISAANTYAIDQKKYLPPNAIPGKGSATAYDLRTWFDDNGVVTPYAVNPGAGPGPATPNLQLGLLPQAGYLPIEKLGKIMHCPVLDNRGNPHSAFSSGAGKYARVGMDLINDYSVGASWYDDPMMQSLRIIIGYHYRAASWEKSTIGGRKGAMRMGDLKPDDLITVDMPDQRFAGLAFGPGSITGERKADTRAFSHPDGYGRSFADGHASFRDDQDYAIAYGQIFARRAWGDMAADGQDSANFCEDIYINHIGRN